MSNGVFLNVEWSQNSSSALARSVWHSRDCTVFRAVWCLLGVHISADLQLLMSCSVFVCPQGMVLSAEYIKKKLEQEMVLSQAFGRDLVSISISFFFFLITAGCKEIEISLKC